MTDETAERAEAERALDAPGARRIAAKDELRRADDALRPVVFRAIQAGVSVRRIAAKTGLSTTTVMLWGRPESPRASAGRSRGPEGPESPGAGNGRERGAQHPR